MALLGRRVRIGPREWLLISESNLVQGFPDVLLQVFVTTQIIDTNLATNAVDLEILDSGTFVVMDVVGKRRWPRIVAKTKVIERNLSIPRISIECKFEICAPDLFVFDKDASIPCSYVTMEAIVLRRLSQPATFVKWT